MVSYMLAEFSPSHWSQRVVSKTKASSFIYVDLAYPELKFRCNYIFTIVD